MTASRKSLVAIAGGFAAMLACRPLSAADPPVAEHAKAVAILKQHQVREVVFAMRKVDDDGHWYANFSTWSDNPNRNLYHDGGRLVRLDVATGETVTLLNDDAGGVRDPQLDYDARKILFSYRQGGQPYYHLCEINLDGSGLRQITAGPFDDIEPTYLPDGDIVFCTSRCKRMVQCWFVRVATIYRCRADGSDIHELSCNLEQDNTPWLLPDGRLLYQRWEYIDRSRVQFHHLWTMHPDGTAQMIYFGNMHPGTVMIDAKPIPGTGNVVASFSPGHGMKEHEGVITVIDPSNGPDDRSMARSISGNHMFRDPYPLSAQAYLVAGQSSISVLDGAGGIYQLYELPAEWRKSGWIHEPRPVQPRSRERIIPVMTDRTQATGTVTLDNVYIGRNMQGVKPGEIRNLLVLEALPKPVNFSGTQEPLSMDGTFTLERVLGTVPVEPDGSAHMVLPALRSLFFVALDENNLSVKRMQSFMTVQPGEMLGCVGCHEERGKSPLGGTQRLAMQHPPDPITPIPGIPDVFDFPRDVQPILDRHCVACHGPVQTPRGGPNAGGVLLDGGRGPIYSISYVTLTRRTQFADGRDAGGNRAPRTIGSAASPLLKKLAGGHHDVKASAAEQQIVRLWVETGAPYPGTYAALGSGMIPPVGNSEQVRSVLERRCNECHLKPPCPGGTLNFDIIFNFTEAEKSLALLMPLAPAAGGNGRFHHGRKSDDQAIIIFKDKSDPDYQTLLDAVVASKTHLDKIKRFDMPGFLPNEHYLREMNHYGVLPDDFDPKQDPLDPYDLDRRYWKSLQHQPVKAPNP
ncbi:MAG: hypothetical protein NTW21_09030 [Verrucomicrobia bacterium]|nr:hypothetical protein [Verrucomicrobiota bacterium]